uniref:DNA methyltransferase 1-associated 1 domain-containing protein n=1 Tax=Hyaloperonospora arabidopsidis (strain Emoy2) TaxID=559515 RepID=M4BK86_HYAAE
MRGELEKRTPVSCPPAASTLSVEAAPSSSLSLPGAVTSSGAALCIKTEPRTAPSTPVAVVSTPTSSEYYRFNIAYEKQRKQQLDLTFTRSIAEENEIRRLNDELRGVEQQLKKVAAKTDPKKKKELADVPYEIKRALPTGVILRSSLLALPQQKHALSAKLLKKLQLLLDEMGVPARPMPTKPVCETFDKLRQDAVGLLSLRKHLKSKENEVRALRERYHALTGQEYKPITTPVTVSDRPGDAASSASGNPVTLSANHPQNTMSKGAVYTDCIS